jgi:hypothetical protein
VLQSLHAKLAHDAFELPGHHGIRHTGFTLRQGFADAHDRRELHALGRAHLTRDQPIVLAMHGPTLGMADDDVPTAQFLQHRRGDFARERATLVLAHVLSPPGDRTAGKKRLSLGEEGIRDEHRARTCPICGKPAFERAEQRFVLGQAAVHLPVAGDELAAHHDHQRFKTGDVTVYRRGGSISPESFQPKRPVM